MIQAMVAAVPDWGALIQFLVTGAGIGLGAGLGVRLAIRRRSTMGHGGAESAPSWEPAGEIRTPSRAVWAGILLFAIAIGFSLIGFSCGALSVGAVQLLLGSVRIIAAGVAMAFDSLVVGLVAAGIAGYLTETLGRRFQTLASQLRETRVRVAVIALGVDTIMLLLFREPSNFGVVGTFFANLGVGVISVAVSLAIPQIPRSLTESAQH